MQAINLVSISFFSVMRTKDYLHSSSFCCFCLILFFASGNGSRKWLVHREIVIMTYVMARNLNFVTSYTQSSHNRCLYKIYNHSKKRDCSESEVLTDWRHFAHCSMLRTLASPVRVTVATPGWLDTYREMVSHGRSIQVLSLTSLPIAWYML